MVGMGLIMLAISWLGNFLRWRGRLESNALVSLGNLPLLPDRLHRHPRRVVHRRGRTPALGRLRAAAHQRRGYSVAHDQRRLGLARQLHSRLRRLYLFGIYYIYKLLQQGPTVEAKPIPGATGSRPMAFADTLRRRPAVDLRQVGKRHEVSNLALFWAGVLGAPSCST